MTAEFAFAIAAACLFMTGLAALGVRTLADFSRAELDEIGRHRNAPDRLGQILRGDEQARLALETLQFLSAAAYALALAWGFANQPAIWLSPGSLTLRAFLGAVLLLAFELWIPWTVSRLWAARVLFFTWPLWRAVAAVLGPVVLGARLVDTILHRMAGRRPAAADEDSFEEEIRTVVTQGHREGLLEEDAREMIEGVIELGEVVVSQIMTPRTDMISMPLSTSWQEGLDLIVRMGHSRVPVYDRNRDDIVGILCTKDLLPKLARGAEVPEHPWSPLLREPYFVPETKPVDVLLQEFQRTGNHMAVVLDEYGGVSGLVTLEDALEEIVGEIIDESDPDLVDGIKTLGQGVAEVLGRVHIDEINERLETALPEDGDYDTIAGYAFSELGRIPAVGEQLTRENVRITVLEATRRRIERVRIEVLDAVHSGEDHAT